MTWVDLSLFYSIVPPHADDPADLDSRGVLLSGEGLLVPQAEPKSSVRRENLGDGLHLLRVNCPADEAFRTLTNPVWDCRLSGHRRCRFEMGLMRRPPILLSSFPDPQNALGPSFSRPTLVHLFVRRDKDQVFRELAGAPEPSAASKRAAGHTLSALRAVTGVDFYDSQCTRLGGVVLCDPDALVDNPIEWHSRPDSMRRRCTACEVVVRPELVASNEVVVNLRVLGADLAVVDDRLITWRRGCGDHFPIQLNQQIAGAWVRAWENGRLISEYRYVIILKICTNMVLVGSTHSLSDRLTELVDNWMRSRDDPGNLAQNTKHIHTQSTPQPTTAGAEEEPWHVDVHSARASSFAWAGAPAAGSGYFAGDPSGRAAAVLRIAELIAGAQRA